MGRGSRYLGSYLNAEFLQGQSGDQIVYFFFKHEHFEEWLSASNKYSLFNIVENIICYVAIWKWLLTFVVAVLFTTVRHLIYFGIYYVSEIVPNACNRTISPCKHGDCIWTGVNYTCLCDDGYTGKNCEIGLSILIHSSTNIFTCHMHMCTKYTFICSACKKYTCFIIVIKSFSFICLQY